MTCKIDHGPDGMPQFLCRTCNPDAFKNAKPIAVTVEPAAPVIDPTARAMVINHRIKKLRKEERRLSNLIDDIGDRDPKRRAKLFAAIKEVETAIDAERARL